MSSLKQPLMELERPLLFRGGGGGEGIIKNGGRRV